MYTNPQNGQATTATVAPTLHLGTYRRAILRLVVGNDLFTAAEQLRCNDSVHQCENSAKLALWLKNVRHVAAEREAQAEAQALANMAQGIERFDAQLATAPVRYATAEQTSKLHQLALHRTLTDGERTQLLLKLPRLTEAQAAAKLTELQTLTTTRGGTAAPANGTEQFTTPAQCELVVSLAASLPRAERADALRRLPYLTEHEAAAFITGLRLRQGSRLRLSVQVGQHLVQVPVAERHFNAALVDYVAETGTGRVLPRYESLYGGPLVRRVWAN
jgi:hypothetical protein